MERGNWEANQAVTTVMGTLVGERQPCEGFLCTLTIGEEPISIQTVRGSISARFARPSEPFATLAVAHGASRGMGHPFIVEFTRACLDEGLATLRFNFPYAESGHRTPDPYAVLQDAWRGAFDAASRRSRGLRVWAGGKSLGGRVASICVADEEIAAAGLVFLGYPLHGPGKPERVRIGHLYRVGVPMLFVQGTADPFGHLDAIGRVVEKLGVRASLLPIEGGHSFDVPGRKNDPHAVGGALARHVSRFIRAHS